MKKLSTKVLSLLLSIILVVSTVSVAFAAGSVNTIDAVVDTKYFQNTTDAQNAKVILDLVDEKLATLEKPSGTFAKVLDVLGKLGITVSYESISKICQTIDSVGGAVNLVGGDLGDFNFDVWKNGMKRTGNDVDIFNELIELIGTTQKRKIGLISVSQTNPQIISKAIDGTLDLGLAGDFVSLEDLLGADGFYGIIKGMLIKEVLGYEEGSAQYAAAYAKKLDNIIYEDVIPAKVSSADGILPGFAMNGDSTIDSLLVALLSSAWDKYIIPAIKGVNDNWLKDSNGNIKSGLEDLAAAINFDGASFDESSIKIDTSKSFAEQINNIVGTLAKFFVPGAPWTDSTDYKKLSSNLNGLYLYVAKQLNITSSDTASQTVALDILKYIVARLEGDEALDYTQGIASCKTIKDAVAIILKNTARINNIPITSSASATYEEILGDYLVYFTRAFVDLGYTAGTGKNVWTVANDILNVYLFDRGVAKALGLTSLKSTDSVFTKFDAIIAMTGVFNGLTPAENYKSENFLKGLLEALFSLDLTTAVDMTAVRFLGDFGSKKAVPVLYDIIYNTCKSCLGADIIVKRSDTDAAPLDTAISNKSLKSTVYNLLVQLNAKKANILPALLYLGAIIIEGEDKATAISVSDQLYTGGEVLPQTVTVKVGSTTKTLVLGHDYTATTESTSFNPGDTVTAKLELNGFVEGTAEVSYKIILDGVKNLKAASVSTTSATLTWDAVKGAQKYEVTLNGKVVASPTTNTLKLSSLTSATEYKYSVCAVYGTEKGTSASVTFITTPKKAYTPKASSITSSSLKLSWTATANATGYQVERLSGSTWKRIATVTTNSYTVTGLSAKTAYQFRIRAYKKGTSATVYGDYSSVLKATTLIATPTLKASSASNTTIKVTWSKVSGAAGYSLEKYDGSKWVVAKNTTATTYTFTKLTANKTYSYRVRAYYKNGSTTVYGAYSTTLKVSTAPAKVTSVKISSPTSTTLKVSWKAASGATSYIVYYSTNNKTWKSVTTTKTSVTLTKLSSNKKYYVKVKPIKKTASINAAGQYSSTVTGTTMVAKVTGLKASKTTKNSVTLTWSKVSGASGYTVYRYNGKKWVKVASVTGNTYTNSNLSRNTSYKYYVAAYKTVSKKAYYGDNSATVTARTKLF